MFKVAESLFTGVNGAQIRICQNKGEKILGLPRKDRVLAIRKRTPEQADHTNEHEPEVRRDNREVDGLSGYINGPGITKERT